ncbi:MAG TPA: tryptophan 7-halogenase [Candidatus Angelobacter sp.]|nr:tryptophan 7-halogenase [Candidatus Angelobacter sp.]
MNSAPPERPDYDVVIAGGALAGAATAILLLREQPQLRVLIVEKSSVFGRRVGEATVEISGYFLCRVLGLTQYLNESHLVKQGMRFWFANSHTQTLEDCSEIGGKYLSRVASFQLDRAALDEEVLKRATALGAKVWRPATIGKIRLNPGGIQTIEVKIPEPNGESRNPSPDSPAPGMRTISARWFVDASGVAALLARQEGWLKPNTEHPTTAVWARWTGVKDWDGWELAQKFPKWSKMCFGIRSTATNHLVGSGWWAWVIPLKGGDVSIGVVFDQRLVNWPEGGSLGQRLKDFLMAHPVGREMLADAQWRESDVHWRKNLPYCSTTFAGDGFAIVGDAGAFIDPFYSPGMDWVSYTSCASAKLILAQQRGEQIAPLVARHNKDFSRSYARWFGALYKDKYEYLGDFDFMRIAFQMDIGLYILFVASQPFKWGMKALAQPVFSVPLSIPFYHFMRFYNRRLAQMARARRRRGVWGRTNDCRRYLVPGFGFSPKTAGLVARGLFNWAWLELSEGWRSWFEPPLKAEQGMQPASPAVQTAP